MSIYANREFSEIVAGHSYPGRGIIIGKTPDGKKAVTAYFIMGRSQNSRNRIFVERDGAVFTEPFDPSKLEDPSLIIYAPIRSWENKLIVSNGNQTDTVYEGLMAGKSEYESLRTRCFEPDAPNLTPRISGVMTFDEEGDFSYNMSILKSGDADGSFCNRFFYEYESFARMGHSIHTYERNESPLPTFQGEPRRVAIPEDMDEFFNTIWSSLDDDNKISLYLRTVDLVTGEVENRMVNKYE